MLKNLHTFGTELDGIDLKSADKTVGCRGRAEAIFQVSPSAPFTIKPSEKHLSQAPPKSILNNMKYF